MKLILGMGNKNKASKFAYLMSNLKVFTDSVTLQFSEDGIFAQGMGFDHVSLFEFQIVKDWFEFYEFNNDDKKTITINSNIIQKIFQMRQLNQHIVVEYKGNPDKISIHFKNRKKSNLEIPKEFEIQLMDVEQEQLAIPQVDYDSEFIILTKVLENISNQLLVFDETFTIKCSENTIDFAASGIDGGLNINLFNDKVDCIEDYVINEDTELNLEFSNSHFQNFCKFSKIADEVKICFSDEYPMQMLFNLNEKNKDTSNDSYFELENLTEKSFLRFCLAPKISDDE